MDPVTETETRYNAPAPALLQPCPKPQWSGGTYADLVDYAKTLQGTIAKCNKDKKALRDWAQGLPEHEPAD